MSEHTPGPWLIAGATHIYAAGKNGANICSVSEPRATTSVQYTPLELGSKDGNEAYANAHLIAAAPNMLAGLKELVDFCDDPEGDAKPESLASGLARMLPGLRAAIALAEGRGS